ncbi:MAG: ATP-binding protein [Defluviitaleaceae bacterium]|nr:ATP-binding protein [Defluviitaleaceae bacterium]MCL2262547.1 ATP-binding protein [Defluviitaleaceae bacterium]
MLKQFVLKRLKLKRATQFTLFATFLMLVTMLALYLVMVANLNNHLETMGFEGRVQLFSGGWDSIILVIAGILAFTVSSIIIENVLNPLRQMISKVREIGEMNFGSPLIIDEDDDELREYALAFNTMAAKLNRYIEMQNRFVADASHELATPITIINGHADLLLRHGYNPNSTDVIKHEIQRMSGLVDSLLLLARSDSGSQSYKFETTDITALISEIADEFRLVSPNFTFETDAAPELSAVCDEYAIRRVIRILLSNAIKYSADECLIKITAALTANGFISISVHDSGIGIPPEHLPHIFERFYRADPSRSRKTGSSGLGLSIAHEIISAHHGEISAKSSPAATTLTFSIPS